VSAVEWRVDGTFGNPSYLAVYLLFHVFIALFFMWQERKNKTLRWVYGILIASQIFALYHTATRGAILGLLGGILVFAALNIRNRDNRHLRKIGIATVSTLALVLIGFWFIKDTSLVQKSPVLERFANISTEELRGGGRSFIWPMAVKGILDKPVLGWGQENFSHVFSKYYDPDMYQLEPWFDRAHNIFLDWGIAGGLPGLISYLSLYAVLLFVIWKRDQSFSYVEKSLLTGLVFAYFIHNFFVFDHLVSYILFFSVLAYVHSRSEGPLLWNREVSRDVLTAGVVPTVAILVLLSLYFLNLKPIQANTSLINALNYMQVDGQEAQAVVSLKEAYQRSALGRSEVVEHITTEGLDILESGIPVKDKNSFFEFARTSVRAQADEFPREARLQIIAGTFLASTGKFDEAKIYFDRAREVMPNKQIIYFQSGSSYVYQKDYVKALQEFKIAYDLAPGYSEARIIYLVGAIYVGDKNLETQLIGELTERQYIFEDRILSAYYDSGRMGDTIRILKRRAELDPSRASEYQKYIDQLQ
jgi:tetratricopeptide (TPR) repeat protein